MQSAVMRFGRRNKTTSVEESPTAELRLLLERWAASQTRPAWRPIVSPTAEQSSALSKFGGLAALQTGEAPPTCKLCGRALQLFVQLDLAALPTMEYGTGVLQLFYCVGQRHRDKPDGHPECWADGAWAPFSNEASLVRVLPVDSLTIAATSTDSSWPEVSIVGWDPLDDVPDPEDHASCGLECRYDVATQTVTLRCPTVGVASTIGIDDLAVEDIASAAERDKLGGWPSWIQGADYPNCPTCYQPMRLVLQVDSDDHIPYMFGDSRIGHITQCAEHQDVVAFGWACC